MAEKVTVKLYFDDSEDVRKIALDKDDLTLDRFSQRIKEIHPDVSDPFSIQYVDQDGDRVSVHSSDELSNAFTDQVNQPYKFQIKSSRKIKTPDHHLNEVHEGCLCTCCHEVIRGFRYKCLNCSNYDICQR